MRKNRQAINKAKLISERLLAINHLERWMEAGECYAIVHDVDSTETLLINCESVLSFLLAKTCAELRVQIRKAIHRDLDHHYKILNSLLEGARIEEAES